MDPASFLPRLSTSGLTSLSLFLLIFGGSACAGPAPTQLHGHWVYASGESEGSTTAVYGDLKFAADGTFDDSRKIGGIGGYRKGTYTVADDKLTLAYDGGQSQQTYTISFGTSTDTEGNTFATLLLRGNSLSFLLTKKAS